jgi:hypothetical protein
MSTSEASSSQRSDKGAYPTVILALWHRVEGKGQFSPMATYLQVLRIPITYIMLRIFGQVCPHENGFARAIF